MLKRRGVTQLASGAEGCETGPLRRPEAGRTRTHTSPNTGTEHTEHTSPTRAERQVPGAGGWRRETWALRPPGNRECWSPADGGSSKPPLSRPGLSLHAPLTRSSGWGNAAGDARRRLGHAAHTPRFPANTPRLTREARSRPARVKERSEEQHASTLHRRGPRGRARATVREPETRRLEKTGRGETSSGEVVPRCYVARRLSTTRRLDRSRG